MATLRDHAYSHTIVRTWLSAGRPAEDVVIWPERQRAGIRRGCTSAGPGDRRDQVVPLYRRLTFGSSTLVGWSMRPWECAPPDPLVAHGFPGSHGPSIDRHGSGRWLTYNYPDSIGLRSSTGHAACDRCTLRWAAIVAPSSTAICGRDRRGRGAGQARQRPGMMRMRLCTRAVVQARAGLG